MDFLYITEKSSSSESTDFVMLDENGELTKFSGGAQLALGSGIGITSLVASAFFSPKTENKAETDRSKKNQEIEKYNAYMKEHSLTKSEAKSEGFEFPAGHPIVEQGYKLHPLAEQCESKKRFYIPADSYDDFLMQERESELFKLLVTMGATEIEISTHVENIFENNSAHNLTASNAINSAGYQSSSSRSSDINSLNTRKFTLCGVEWKKSDTVNPSDFLWLEYEPSWQSLIFAREVAGCTSAAIEIKESSKYSLDRNVAIQVKAKILEAQGGLKLSKSDYQKTSYLVKAKFTTPIE